ncbi:toxin VasX [Burkholderia arboris]|uniref:toxin VasX n=1 Tax=Burkholderia arboris TaxID=488730 RepID=UPI0030F326A9
MATTSPKALGPNRPNEKQVGKAISPPSCERGVPVYPLRYGIADQAPDKTVFSTLGTDGYPALTAGRAYGLRVLRPGSYVYLCYFENGRMWTQHYQVTEQVRFARIWWRKADDDHDAPGRLSEPDTAVAKPYLLAPETAETVYVLAADTVLTHDTLWRIETNKDGLRDKLATTVKPANGVGQPHAFNAALLGNATRELVPPAVYGVPMQYTWSEISLPDGVPGYGAILTAMSIATAPRKDITPLAVVLQDPIGVVSELHHLAADAVKAKARYEGKHAHKLQSAKYIADYFAAAQQRAQRSPDVAKVVARQRDLIDYNGAIAFPAKHANQLSEFDTRITIAVSDVVAWVKHLGKPRRLGAALSCFDLTVLCNARDYEKAVFQCLGALVHTDEGQKTLADIVEMSADESPYWLALINGSQVLMERVKDKTLDIARNVFDVVDKFLEEHAATPATNALIGLLQALPPERSADVLVRRMRHVLEIRFNATIVLYELAVADFQRFLWEFQGFQTLGAERMRGWQLSSPTVIHVEGAARVVFYDWVKVGETTFRELDQAPPQRPALPPKRPIRLEGNPFVNAVNRVRGPGGYVFTGVGGYLAWKGLKDAGTEFNMARNDAANFASFLGAGSALIGTGIEMSATAVAFGAEKRINATLAASVRVFSAKYGVAMFGAGGAGLAALADTVRAGNALSDSNTVQASMYLTSGLAGGVMALAAWGGGTATVATIVGGTGPAAAVLGLTPAGWVVVGLIALGVGIAFSVGADLTKHGPVEIWLKHSAWGANHRHYTNSEELDAIHGLYFRPRLSAEWDQASGYEVGTLRIHCQLPGANDRPGERFQARLKVTLRGNLLTRIDGPIMHPMGSNPINYKAQCLVTALGHTGSECGWAIQMHEDSVVALEYLYRPAPETQPGLVIDQAGAPAPLVFTSSGVFRGPIDPAKLEPVRAPK